MVTSYEGNPSKLFITRIGFEYHNLFHRSDILDFSIFEYYNLFNFLTEEEIDKLTQTGGKITTLELDEILVHLHKNYHNELYDDLFSESSNSLTLN